MQEENQIQTKEIQDDNLLTCLAVLNRDKEIVLIYTNAEQTQNFSAGVISEIFDNEVIISHYLPNGKYDGYVVKQISNIYKIETDSKYVKKIKILGKINKTKYDQLCRVQGSGFLTLLTYAHETKKVVTVELINSGNNDATGFVQQINDKYCIILMLDEYGENDGVSMFNIEDISHLSCDGDDEIVLKQLHDALYDNQTQ
ncbi:hypothetical protein [Caproiciproducens sp. CPB-2]|uniref:hypothetical protein n=1 Tax=Caproiciproducens sp. CPB-2 TaxID=3030017 RepID=UPI0023DB7B4F|nr:hypothetical protein [Caproiciproducens sp. CPB-2]MDF1494829.1 hypothetical protein [Caproiciproducens sp. CPB-2]